MQKGKDDLSTASEVKIQKTLMVMITMIFLLISLFTVSFFAYGITHVKRADQIRYTCDELTGFEWIKGDDRIPISLPIDTKLKKGETFIYETTLPGKISDDTWICYASGKDTKIYVGDELRMQFEKDRGTIPGGAVKSLLMFVELFPSDTGKVLRIVRDGNSYNGSNIRPVYIGTSLGIIEKIISDNIVFFIFSIALLIISLIAIGIGLLLRFYKKIQSPITSMGIGVLFVCLWLIFDSELYQLAFRMYFLDGTMSFIMMLLIPYPFLYYLDLHQGHRYRTFFASMLMYFQIATICALLLHFSGTSDLLSMLPFLALSEGVIIAGAIYSMVRDLITGAYKSYLVSFIGVSGLIISGVLELILVNTVYDRYDGSCIIAGLFWTITLAILHQLYAVRSAQNEAAVAIRASETKTNFLANMSHEIRTPMNAILGMDEMILREAKKDSKIAKYASDIKSAGNMLLSIINDILDLSKIESGKAELVPVDFEICSVINDIINITKKRANDKGLSYSFDASGDIPVRFNGDEIRARQIMLNIINNAVKYTNSGSVSVNLTMLKSEDDSDLPIGEGDTVTLVIKVKDTGIGIKESDLDKLFTPFDRLEETKNRNVEGTGLGLNIAGNYVELMGGHIDVESVYNEGSTFTVYMPLKVADTTPIGDFTERIRTIHENKDVSKTTVLAPNASALVIDDNEMNLEVIAGLMERTKIKVDIALSGKEGIEKMEKRRYDIIFLDQMMPGMDGVTTLREMLFKFDMRGVSVIALTADAVAGAREYYLEKGFDDYLSKPVKAEALESIIKEHLPKNLLISEQEIARILDENEKRESKKEDQKSVIFIDPDSESLKQIKEKTEGLYKGTFVTDMEKARKYLEKHDADYVMVRKDILFGQNTGDKE